MIKELLLASALIMPLNQQVATNIEFKFDSKNGELIEDYYNFNDLFDIDFKIQFKALLDKTTSGRDKLINLEVDLFNNQLNLPIIICNDTIRTNSTEQQINIEFDIPDTINFTDIKYYDSNNYLNFSFFIDNYDNVKLIEPHFYLIMTCKPKNEFTKYSLNTFLFNYASYLIDFNFLDHMVFDANSQFITTEDYVYQNSNRTSLSLIQDYNYHSLLTLNELNKQTINELIFNIGLGTQEIRAEDDNNIMGFKFKAQATTTGNNITPDTSNKDLIPIRACPAWYDLPCQAMNGLATIINKFPFLGEFLGKMKSIFISPILALTEFLKGLFGL